MGRHQEGFMAIPPFARTKSLKAIVEASKWAAEQRRSQRVEVRDVVKGVKEKAPEAYRDLFLSALNEQGVDTDEYVLKYFIADAFTCCDAQMLDILACFAVGAALGLLARRRGTPPKVDKLIRVLVVPLVFFVGLRVGATGVDLLSTGALAALLGILSVVLSALTAWGIMAVRERCSRS